MSDEILQKLDVIIGLLSHRIVMGESGKAKQDAERLVVKILRSAKVPSKQIALALGKTDDAIRHISSRHGK
jgi:hypothetical protein